MFHSALSREKNAASKRDVECRDHNGCRVTVNITSRCFTVCAACVTDDIEFEIEDSNTDLLVSFPPKV